MFGINDLRYEFQIPEGRYKLFTCTNYRNIVLNRLKQDLKSMEMVNDNIPIRLRLVAGHVYKNRSKEIREYFESKKWFFWTPDDVRDKVTALASKGYENDPVIITAKILMKGPHNKII